MRVRGTTTHLHSRSSSFTAAAPQFSMSMIVVIQLETPRNCSAPVLMDMLGGCVLRLCVFSEQRIGENKRRKRTRERVCILGLIII